MADTDAEKALRLEKPGAGLPWRQALMMKYVVGPFVSKRSNWDEDTKGFAAIYGKVLREAQKLTEDEMMQKVLVPPQAGLEDSSRYWSAAMVLEHMVIVGAGVKNIVISLSKGVVPDYKVEVARVKPKGALTAAAALASYEEFVSTAQADIAREAGGDRTASALVHPWFGPFTAHQWHWLLTGHGAIHLKQMREIVKRLKPATAPAQ